MQTIINLLRRVWTWIINAPYCDYCGAPNAEYVEPHPIEGGLTICASCAWHSKHGPTDDHL